MEDRIEVTLEKMQKEQLENMRRGRNNSKEIVFIIYSRKVQIKYIADTRLQGRNQEKHMVIWL